MDYKNEPVLDLSVVIRSQHLEIFGLADDLLEFCKHQQETVSVEKSDEQKLVSFLLYCRVIEGLASAIYLLERGMRSYAEVVVRSMLGSAFRLAAIAKSAARIEDYKRDGNVAILKMIRRVLANRRFEDRLENRRRELETIVGPKAALVSDETWAEWAGMDTLYDHVYSLHSLPTHGNIRTLDRYSEENGVLWYGPDVRSTEETMVAASQISLVASKVINNLCGNGSFERWPQIESRWTQVANRLADKW